MVCLNKEKIITILIVTGVIILTGYITVYYLLKGKQVVVSDIRGYEVKEAVRICKSRGLYLKERAERFDENIPEGCIISQDPLAGEYVKKGRTVFVTVSRGLKMISVPDLKDESLRQAKIRLSQSLLTVGTEFKVYSKKVPEGYVITQNPVANLSVERNTPVNLLVSLGEREINYIMPDLTKGKFSNVRKELYRSKIMIKKVSYTSVEEVEKDTVVAQEPLAGFKIRKGDSVTLTVNLKESEKNYRLINVMYNVPKGNLLEKRVKLIILDNDGSKEIFNDLTKGGNSIEKTVKVNGEAILQVYINNEFVEERKYD